MPFKFKRPENDDRNFDVLDWDNVLSTVDVCEIYNVTDRTIRRHIKAGVFTDGVDSKRFEKIWLFDRRRCDELYKKREYPLDSKRKGKE